MTAAETPPPGPALVIVWDPALVSPGRYARLVSLLGDLARAEGAAGIVRLAPCPPPEAAR